MITTNILMIGIPLLLALILIFYVLKLRRIVPTNMVHIVQRGKKTVSYGKSHDSGNVYYEFPKWVPIIGIIVRELPVSNFDIDINDYVAYDKDRLPFMLHVKAFFHISDTNKAAEKVESYAELKAQLDNVVKGAIRSILANETLHKIMEERAIFGKQFTESVNEDLKQWGVEAVKNIELMDIKDDKTSGSTVISQIMDMKKSSIAMESRKEIANNNKLAEQAELSARQQVEVTKAETERISGEAKAASQKAVGIANAMSEKESGIAKQESASAIAEAEKSTAEKKMEVVRVNQVAKANIDKESAIINANKDKETIIIDAQRDKELVEIQTKAEKYKIETTAEANLAAKNKEAEGVKSIGIAEAEIIKAKGLSEAESKQAFELASVTAQTTLAEKIGKDKDYQAYMIEVKKVEVSQVIGVAQAEAAAKAYEKAEMKFLVNSGDVHSGLNKLSDIFTSKGGSQLNGLMESLSQTEGGQAILDILEKFGLKTPAVAKEKK